MENDPPGVETMPLTPTQAAAREQRIRVGLAKQSAERAQQRLVASRIESTAVPAAPRVATPPMAFVTAATPRTESQAVQKQQAARALATAMAKHGSAFRVRVMSTVEWDAVAAVRMRDDKCDKATALERECFVSPFINVRDPSKG